LAHWFGECNIENTCLDDALRALSFTPPAWREQRKALLALVHDCRSLVDRSEIRNDAVARVAGVLADHAAQLREQAAVLEADASS
jgi:hypothetical protein